MANEKKEKEEQMAYRLPSNSDINKEVVISLIHNGEISENYIPDYNTILDKYIKLSNLRNIKTTNLALMFSFDCCLRYDKSLLTVPPDTCRMNPC